MPQRNLLLQTLAGNDVPILTITSPDPVFDIKNKKFVIITSRVHPGESPSSFIMRGILHFVTGGQKKQNKRDKKPVSQDRRTLPRRYESTTSSRSCR